MPPREDHNDQGKAHVMKHVLIIAAASLCLSGAAFAAKGPTKAQCHGGWKAEYSKMWSEADFKKACDAMMK